MDDAALISAPPYNKKVLIGNCMEDRSLEELKQKDFLQKKDVPGGLKVNQAQALLQATLAGKQLSSSENGAIKFGSVVMVSHACGVLSCDASDRVSKSNGAPAIAATTSKLDSACIRNALVIERADDDDGFEGDHLHYGQKFRLRCQGTFDGYLHSEFVSPMAAAKVSRKQEVCFHSKSDGFTVWQCTAVDSREALKLEGEKVCAGENVVMKHKATGVYLGSNKQFPYQNLFGAEFEVHCSSYLSKNKVHTLYSEQNGQVTGDQNLRHIEANNFWSFVTSDCKSE